MTTSDTEPTRWRKKPVEIEAMQLAGTTSELHAVYLWVEGNFTLMAAGWFQRRLRDALEAPDA